MGKIESVQISDQLAAETTTKNAVVSAANKKPTSTINYRGEVTFTVKRNGKTIYTNKQHNIGKYNLFKYLCNCLVDNHMPSERPGRIVLFGLGDETTDTPAQPTLDGNTALTNPLLYNTTAEVTEVNTPGADSYVAAVYHFVISGALIRNSNIYKLALYAIKDAYLQDNISESQIDRINDYENKAMAVYTFTKETSESATTLAEWDPKKIVSADSVVYIDWELAVGNF